MSIFDKFRAGAELSEAEKERQKQIHEEMKDAAKAKKHRKAETARKVRLGEYLIKRAQNGDRKAEKIIKEIIKEMPEYDRKVFQDWKVFPQE